ncbi:MAG: EthD domain-containing protein [Thermoanaerobaculales bacterium]
MIKFIQCVKAKSDLSIPEFRRHWQEYEKRALAIAGATDAVRVVANLTLAVEQNLEIRLNRGTAEPFDGVLEISWYNAAGLGKALEDEENQELLGSFQEYQVEFIDFDRSSFFFTSEEVILERS